MTVRANKPAFNIREKLKELTHNIGLKGRELMGAATAQEARDLVSAGRKNLIQNGALNVWQRGTAQTTITSGREFLADRWGVATAGSAQVTHELSTDAPAGFAYSLKVSPSVTDTLVTTEQSHITQIIEAQNLTFLKWGTREGIPITISFWAKSNTTANKCLWIYAQDAGDHIARQFNLSKPNVWEKFTFIIPPNPGGVIANDNGAGIYVRITLDSGPDAANGSLPTEWSNLSSNGRYGTLEPGFLENTANEFYLTGVQVEAGKNATDFEHRFYGEELALCQRYFYKFRLTNQEWIYNEGTAASNKWHQFYIGHSMRPISAIDVTDMTTGGSIGGLSGTVNSYSPQIPGDTPSKVSSRVTMSANGGTARNLYHYDGWNADYISVSAEL